MPVGKQVRIWESTTFGCLILSIGYFLTINVTSVEVYSLHLLYTKVVFSSSSTETFLALSWFQY